MSPFEARSTQELLTERRPTLDLERLLPVIRLLRNGQSGDEIYSILLQKLGEMLETSVALLFQVVERTHGFSVETRAVWLPGSADPAPQLHVRLSMERSGLKRWTSLLAEGHSISGARDTLPLSEQAFLSARKLGSVLAVPVFDDDLWWGFFLLGDSAARQWDETALLVGEFVAEMVGVSLSRGTLEERLEHRKEELLELTRVRDSVARELQEIKAWKEKVFSTFSHEFLSPLNTLLGFSSTLIEYEELEADREVRQVCLRNIHEQSQRLEKLVNDLVFASALQSRFSVIDTKPMDIRPILQELCYVFLQRAKRDAVDFSFRFSDTPLVVASEPVLMRQLLFNLLDNALKSTPMGGWMTLNAECASGMVAVKVTDSGNGIPQSELDHIFEPFYSPVYPKASEYSTHLSLSISKQIVDLHAGHIAVDSKEGVGSVFTLTLPLSAG
jgi:signal transduction histidine kinase